MTQENVLALLRITVSDGREEIIQLRQSTVDLGRIPPNDVVLADQQISRKHARLLFEDNRISLIDLNSRNGTFVGTTRLSPNAPYILSYGEVFRLGPFTLRLEAVPVPPPEVKIEQESIPAAEQAPDQVKVGIEYVPPPSVPPPDEPPSPNGDFDDKVAFGLPPDRSRYLQYLPMLYHEHDLLGRFLLAFEGVLAPIEQTVDNFDLYLDPVTTPAYFLDRLASWLGMTLDEKWSLEKRRTLVAEAVELYRRRGTRWSLSRHLEIFTDVAPEISEPVERPHHFKVVLRVPAGHTVDRSTVERIIQANQPAHTTYSLEIVQKS